MTNTRGRFRTVLSRSDCTLAANKFDPLSARIAYMLGHRSNQPLRPGRRLPAHYPDSRREFDARR